MDKVINVADMKKVYFKDFPEEGKKEFVKDFINNKFFSEEDFAKIDERTKYGLHTSFDFAIHVGSTALVFEPKDAAQIMVQYKIAHGIPLTNEKVVKAEVVKKDDPMKKVLNNLKNRISTLSVTISQKDSEIDDLNETINILKKQIANLEAENEQIRNENEELKIYKELVEE